MALTGFILTTLLSTFTPAETTLACTFPDGAKQSRPITLQVEHNPSLFDIGENYQVQMRLSSTMIIGMPCSSGIFLIQSATTD